VGWDGCLLEIPDTRFVDADAGGHMVRLGRIDDAVDVLPLFDIARIQTDLCGPGFNGHDGTVRAEMHVGNEGNIDVLDDLGEGFRVGPAGHRQTDQPTTGAGQLADLFNAGGYVRRWDLGHRLNDNRSRGSEFHGTDRDH